MIVHACIQSVQVLRTCIEMDGYTIDYRCGKGRWMGMVLHYWNVYYMSDVRCPAWGIYMYNEIQFNSVRLFDSIRFGYFRSTFKKLLYYNRGKRLCEARRGEARRRRKKEFLTNLQSGEWRAMLCLTLEGLIDSKFIRWSRIIWWHRWHVVLKGRQNSKKGNRSCLV